MSVNEVRELPREIPAANEKGDVSLVGVLAILLRERKLVVICSAIGLASALIIALFRERIYTTAFSFVPQAAQDRGGSGLAGLAGQLGLSIGTVGGVGQSSQLYADLLYTREVLGPIARDSISVGDGKRRYVSVAEFLRVSGPNPPVVFEKTLRVLRKKVISSAVATRTTGVVSVSVSTRSPQVSLAIAQQLLESVNQFNLNTLRTQAGEERRFIEGRLASARGALSASENVLARFLRMNRQFANSPELSLERDRLQREVDLQQQVVISLAQQYENARIREVRDTPVITVIERPAIAAESDPRGRLRILIGGVLLSFFLGILLALLRDGFSRLQSGEGDPAKDSLVGEWRRIRGAKRS